MQEWRVINRGELAGAQRALSHIKLESLSCMVSSSATQFNVKKDLQTLRFEQSLSVQE